MPAPTKMFVMAMVGAIAQPVTAQFIGGTSPLDMSAQSRALTRSVIGNLSVRQTARRNGDRTNPRTNPTARPTLSDMRFPYRTSPALRATALKSFVERVRRTNPTAANAMMTEFQRPETLRSLPQAMRGGGLSPDDAADVMTIYLVAGWEIVNAGDATPTQIRAVRRQVAGQLVARPGLRDPALRARFAEELKILTTIIGGGAATAKREGSTAAYATRIATYYRTIAGFDFGRLKLTDTGFS